MRFLLKFWVVVSILLAGCGFDVPRAERSSMKASQQQAVTDSVRSFMQTVAHDITRDGPTAWKKHFEDDPAFFMANNGQLAFPDSQTAAKGIDAFARTIKHIELRWGDDLRVDVLRPRLAVVAASYHEVRIDTADHQVKEDGFFTGVVENRSGQWQFRDAHWSEPVLAAKAP